MELLLDGLIPKIVVVILDIIILILTAKELKKELKAGRLTKENMRLYIILYLIKILLELHVVYTFVRRIQLASTSNY